MPETKDQEKKEQEDQKPTRKPVGFHLTDSEMYELGFDGTFTYFRFARNAPVPAIFRHTRGAERSVNSQAQADGVIRVSGVNPEWVLRLGDEVVCIQDLGRRGAGA